MSEKPILFSTPMVQAILAGRKTMTRRVVKPQPEFESGFDYPHEDELGIYWKREESYSGIDELIKDLVKKCPYGQVGDILWVRETWAYREFSNNRIYYKADNNLGDVNREGGKWRPSIFMPRTACRLFLKVTNIRVERLRDITEEDARREGCITFHYKIGDGKFDDVAEFDLTARDAFSELWDSLNSKRGYGWDINPWVWVIEFERIEVK